LPTVVLSGAAQKRKKICLCCVVSLKSGNINGVPCPVLTYVEAKCGERCRGMRAYGPIVEPECVVNRTSLGVVQAPVKLKHIIRRRKINQTEIPPVVANDRGTAHPLIGRPRFVEL